ncbi:glycosyltransferase involved in cell wall biosynthesis [Rhizobium sp. BK619]|uniref:glycosyltransferase family 4 protein n=1 Tax=Rhizobium sp. BK619 TaxID=2586989 RepID=UPI00161EFAC8|nr:glycosyltransferase family 4 protein [Rhizobium sp. BK619]MBB3646338.1 glycosyltransferase involved in cell wall biosynthesis [Rhizobium sp. BK619]
MPTLTFFLSLSGSLTAWKKAGILDREILHLSEYIKAGVFDKINIFSYSRSDLTLLSDLRAADSVYEKFDVLVPSRKATKPVVLLHSIFGPLHHYRRIAASAALKTNQISGSWAALIAKVCTRRPLLLRFGYILSRRFRLNGQRSAAFLARLVERIGLRLADAVVVTSEQAAAEIRGRTESSSKVHLVPTYVDTELFAPGNAVEQNGRFIYVGRLTPQKNLANLIRAAQCGGFEIDMFGEGPLKGDLAALAEGLGAKVRLLGSIPNTELAGTMKNYRYFVLPSLHEGLPKVLLEAMSTGLICVGTNIPGTSDLIKDGVTGYLSDGTTDLELADALQRASEGKNTGSAARALIEERYSIRRYIEQEAAIFESVFN